MAHETLVKRTIWVAECKHTKSIATEDPPKERYCDLCKKWIPFKEESYVGPSLKAGK